MAVLRRAMLLLAVVIVLQPLSAQEVMSGEWVGEVNAGNEVWDLSVSAQSVTLRVTHAGRDVGSATWTIGGDATTIEFRPIGRLKKFSTVATVDGQTLRFAGTVEMPDGSLSPYTEIWRVDSTSKLRISRAVGGTIFNINGEQVLARR